MSDLTHVNDTLGEEQFDPIARPTQEVLAVRPREPARTSGSRISTLRRNLSPALLWRFKWTGLFVALLLAAPLVALVWFTNTPVYEARASVEVSPMIPRIVYQTDDNGLIPLYQQYLNNQASVIRSPTVLERVLDEQKVQATAWYQEPAEKPLFGKSPTKLERLREALEARVRSNTSFVDVKMAARDPEEAALLVNTVVDQYLTYVYERSQQFDDDVYRALTQEYNTLRNTIDGLKSVISDLRGDLMTATPDELQAQQRQRLDQKVAELESLRQELAVANWEREQLEALAAGASEANAADEPHAASPYAVDEEWRRLFLAWRSAQEQLATAKDHLGDEHFQLVALRRAVAHADENLKLHETQLDEIWQAQPELAAARVDSAQVQLDQLTHRVERLQFQEQLKTQDVSQERDRVKETARAAEMLTKEMDELKYAEERYVDVRQRKIAMEIERRAPASIRIQDRAYPPSQPYNARRRLMLAGLALLGSLGCGAATAYVRATTNPAVQQVSDLTDAPSRFLLGQVPLMRRATRPDAYETALQSECIRMVRTALLERMRGGQNCAVQITSAGAGAGKTSVAVLLAESLARCGKRVLLIDGDVRSPSLHERFELPRKPGLMELLRGEIEEADALHLIPDSNLQVICAGNLRDQDAELLAHERLRERIARWKQEYELVIFDSAPLLPVADARIVARQVDASVVVVREGRCRRSEVTEAMSQLNSSGGVLLGMVLLSRRRHGLYYGGRYGYGYGSLYGTTPTGSASDLDAREVVQ